MAIDLHTYELIDKYLLGQLSDKEFKDFKSKLKTDHELAEEVSSQEELISLMKSYEKRNKLKKDLDNIHKEIDVNKVRKKLYEAYLPKKRAKIWHYAATITVAASVAIASLFGILYYTGLMNFTDKMESFSELKKNVDKISSTQRSIWKAFVKSQEKEKSTKYSGTCFSVSTNGYLATNYHLVKNVDSVFITNKIDSVVKYRTEVIYKDAIHDLAILKITDTTFSSFGVLPFTFGGKLADLGEYVFTLGYSKKDIVFGEGAISSLTGYFGDSLSYQISIPSNPGNSGGPIFDTEGNVIGILRGKNSKKANATYAIKSNFLVSVMDSIAVDTNLVIPEINKINSLKWKKRTLQIKDIMPFIFTVEVYR
ncbi:MAG: S1C family serine protease [Bacteroidota bacterium]|nr:S1C family serine protease [Bacteroidota bacterium]